MNIDWTTVIAMVATTVIGIVGVNSFLKNFMPSTAKWIALAKDGVETLSDVADALKPDANGKVELTAEEITKVNADVATFKAQLAVALAK